MDRVLVVGLASAVLTADRLVSTTWFTFLSGLLMRFVCFFAIVLLLSRMAVLYPVFSTMKKSRQYYSDKLPGRV